MAGVAFCARTASDLGFFFSEVKTPGLSNSSPSSFLPYPSSVRVSIPLYARSLRSRRPINFFPICCDSSRGSSGFRSGISGDQDHEFLEASVLVSETTMHYKMRRQGFQEDSMWQASRHTPPFSIRASESRVGVSSIGLGFLRRFKYPTIFLKISCDGDYLLPIIVGDAAIERLLDVSWENKNEECPDQHEFVASAVDKLGYEVKMAKITNRVVNTYYAKLYLGKPGNDNVVSLDAWPSDAINLAKECEAPIYVNKEIVLADAVRIGYGGRPQSPRPIFDAILDSAPEGPDTLSEELRLVRNMNLAAQEERFNDAAMWRDKLKKLQDSTSGTRSDSTTTSSYE